MATLQLMPVTTINGTTYATAQIILTPAPSEKKVSSTKMILPKLEASPTTSCDGSSYTSPPDFLRISQNSKSENAKRRIHFSKKALTHPRPQSVTKRNARERNRMKAVNQGFVKLASHVPAHLRSKKMSKVDTLRAAILYIQDLQEALENDGEMPISSESHATSSDIPSSPATSISSNDTTPSSPSYQPVSPIYRAPAVTCHATSQPDLNPTSQQFNHYPPQQSYLQTIAEQPPVNTSHYHSHQSTQYNYSYQPQVPNRFSDHYSIDFTRPQSTDTCPSPTSSCYTNSDHERITPEVEAELLELASWYY